MVTEETADRITTRFRLRRVPGARSRSAPIWLVLSGFLLVSLVAVPSSVEKQSLNNLIFFGSIAGLIALGQHVVIISGGLDLSVASQLSLAAVLFAHLAGPLGNHSSAAAAGFAILACVGAGVLNGIAVTVLRITPLIATLAMGAVILGATFAIPGARNAVTVPGGFTDLVINRAILDFFSVITVVVIVCVVVVGGVIRWTMIGRRFVAVGDRPRAARAFGLHVDRYRASAYVVASLLYAIAGLILAGVAALPGPALGDPYLLPSIAAVVVGGTALGGGAGAVVATVGGALFMTHLDAVTLSLQAPRSVQLIAQGAVIAGAMMAFNTGLVRRLMTSVRTITGTRASGE